MTKLSILGDSLPSTTPARILRSNIRMHLFGHFWTTVTYFANLLTLSPINPPGPQQYPIPGTSDVGLNVPHPHYPIFKPPGGHPQGPGSDFKCNYSRMPGWYECSTPENRGCWLRHPDGREYNILTDYENDAPIGVDRNYTLVVNDGWVNADGLNFTAAKLFNNTFPGPWIQACWGDVSAELGDRYCIMIPTV